MQVAKDIDQHDAVLLLTPMVAMLIPVGNASPKIEEVGTS